MNTNDIKLYKSQVISDADTNGGYLSYNKVISGVLNNVFPNVTYSERTSGVKRYRKLFLKNDNTANERLNNAHVGLVNPSPADDIFKVFAGAVSDTQADVKDPVTGSPVADKKLFGGGTLVNNVSAGATSIQVLFEDSTFGIEAGDKLLITNTPNPTDIGVEEYITVGGNVTWNGNTATIPLAVGLSGSYVAADPTYVSVMLPLGDIVASYTIDGTTTSQGTYNDTLYPIVVNNQGTIDETWSITFISSTTFDCVGTRTGVTSSGNVTSEFLINNPQTLTPYFSIPSSFWTGTWAIGDTFMFTTISSSKGFWLLEEVPAGANTFANNSVTLRVYGE